MCYSHLFISSFIRSFIQPLSHMEGHLPGAQANARHSKENKCPYGLHIKNTETWIPASAMHPPAAPSSQGCWSESSTQHMALLACSSCQGVMSDC